MYGGESVSEFDVAIIGLGVMGTAALASLARRGCRVIGIDRFVPGHDRGSSHGLTRVIRLGYFEHPSYVPLLKAAYPLWRALETRSGVPLLTVTGIIEIGTPDGELVTGTLQASRLHGLAHDVLDAPTLMQRFPAFRVPDDYVGIFQPDGGFLRAEPALVAMLTEARNANAEIRPCEHVLAVEPERGGVGVTTARGKINASCAVIAAGAWVRKLVSDLPVRATRQVLGWFEPIDTAQAALFSPRRFPVFLLECADGLFYGFPADASAGVKVARHDTAGAAVDPDHHERTVSAADEATIRAVLAKHLPGAAGRMLSATTCLYTMSPDGDFILDRLPHCAEIIVASPCSGHGFKFAPLIGEIIADMVVAGTTAHDISRFSLARFS